MKTVFSRSLTVLAMSTLLAATSARAATEFTIAEVLEASKLATDKFAAENPDHVEHFVGYKSWKTGEDAKVKVYVTHDGMNMEFNYNCHKHDTGMECHTL